MEMKEVKKQQTETNKSREMGSATGKQLLVTLSNWALDRMGSITTEQDPAWLLPLYEQGIKPTQSPGQEQCTWYCPTLLHS